MKSELLHRETPSGRDEDKKFRGPTKSDAQIYLRRYESVTRRSIVRNIVQIVRAKIVANITFGGEFNLAIEGRPDQNQKLGSSYAVPAGAVHYAKVPGDEPLKVLCVFIIDKNRPLATVEGKAA
jgi:hypothetical protein